jgi:lysozyme
MRPVPQIGIDFIKGAEACRLTAYLDSTGHWTIGYGHTGPEVVRGMTITMAQAMAYLFADAVKAAARIANSVTDATIQALSEHQYAALVSFSFNTGFSHQECPTLIGVLEARNFDAVPVQMMRFNHGKVGGVEQVIHGLTHRRMAEVVLWRHPDADAAMSPHRHPRRSPCRRRPRLCRLATLPGPSTSSPRAPRALEPLGTPWPPTSRASATL